MMNFFAERTGREFFITRVIALLCVSARVHFSDEPRHCSIFRGATLRICSRRIPS